MEMCYHKRRQSLDVILDYKVNSFHLVGIIAAAVMHITI